jgi:hypothetical protein
MLRLQISGHILEGGLVADEVDNRLLQPSVAAPVWPSLPFGRRSLARLAGPKMVGISAVAVETWQGSSRRKADLLCSVGSGGLHRKAVESCFFSNIFDDPLTSGPSPQRPQRGEGRDLVRLVAALRLCAIAMKEHSAESPVFVDSAGILDRPKCMHSCQMGLAVVNRWLSLAAAPCKLCKLLPCKLLPHRNFP